MSNREIDFGFGRGAVRVCVRACVRACEAVCGREDDDSSRARPKYWKFVGVVPAPGPPPDVKPKFDFSAPDRIRLLSSASRVFPMGFRPQKSSKFRVRVPPRRPRPPGPNGPAGGWGGFQAQ